MPMAVEFSRDEDLSRAFRDEQPQESSWSAGLLVAPLSPCRRDGVAALDQAERGGCLACTCCLMPRLAS